MKAWVVMDLLHHTTSIITVIPLCRFLIEHESTHRIPLALLLAAGICYGTGQYKFTLDITSKSGLMQVKAIAFIQWATIMYTRVYVWYTCVSQLLIALSDALEAPSHWPLAVTYIGITTMSLFNVVMVLDASGQVVKWLTKPMPASQHKAD